MVLIITDIKRAETEEDIQGREEEAKDIELAGSFRWESVSITPEEKVQQLKDFMNYVKKIKPFTNEFLQRQKERVNELAFKLMADETYFRHERY